MENVLVREEWLVPFSVKVELCAGDVIKLYHLHLPEINWQCSLKTARQVYDFGCNTLGYLCEQLGIPEGTHHRAGDDAEMCARLFLKENKDTESTIVTKI